MSEEKIVNEEQPLGAFLRDTRESHGFSLDDVQDATKISMPILKAIENDDFEVMPAEAFCRGFYVMYAKFLQLDSKEILARYLDSRGLPPIPSKNQPTPPVRKSRHFSNYSEPSAVLPQASLTAVLLTSIAVFIGICWYLDWNPVSYFNTKLDSMRNPATQEEIAKDNPATPALSPPQEVVKQTVEEVTAVTPYHLEIDFRSTGSLTVTLDKGFAIDKHYVDGQTLQWEVEESIVLDMPESIDATLRLNGIELLLPPPANGRRLLSLPEDLLN